MEAYKPIIFSCFKGYTKNQILKDIVAGIIVAIIALPLSIALAVASGVEPQNGIYTAIFAGFVIGLLGGSRVQISGPTAAFATIVAGIVASNGMDGLIIATIMAGILLIVMGLCRLGKLIKYVPTTVTLGFTMGIAITLAIGQFKDLLGVVFSKTNVIETLDKLTQTVGNIKTFSWQALIIGGVALAVLIIWPKIKYINIIPPSLIVVLVCAVMVIAFKMDNVNTIGSVFPKFNDMKPGLAALPSFTAPQFTMDKVVKLLPDAITIAILAGIESLLSCVVSDGMIKDKHRPNAELIAQGAGNIVSVLFGGIPATGAIARTAANVKNGGRSPISAIVHALVLLLVLLLLIPYAALIPMPAIAAILIVVAYNMSEWREFAHILKSKKVLDIIVLVFTCILTVVFNLVVAIVVGLVLSAIFALCKKMMSKKETAQ